MTRVRRWTRGNRWKKSGPFAIPLRHWVFRRSEEHTSELQSRLHLVCRLLLEKKNPDNSHPYSPALAIVVPLVAFRLPSLDTSRTVVRRFPSRRPCLDGRDHHIPHRVRRILQP